jgi:hypothetical protein
VKAAYNLAALALPKAGGVITGALEIGNTGSLVFEGSTNDGFETTLAVADPTADRTITLPNVSGTVVTTGDTGSVTSTMIADGAIVNADINASAAIVDTKLATIATAGKVSNSATTATSANTASAIVARDASGNFTAGTITGTTTNCSRSVLAGNGITGGGALSANVTLTLGTPSSLTGTTANAVTSTSHTHAITVNLAALAGTTAGPTITSSAGTNVVIPSASGSASGIVTTGAQTFAGVKTFSSNISGSITGNAATVTTNANLTGDITSVGNATTITAGIIDNANINASAAIAGTKISPNFGSQTIVTTGVHSAALGAVATPSIAFTGDLNTGIYSPGADQLAVSTGGVERVEFGTTEVVFNDGGADVDFRIEGDTNANLFKIDAGLDQVQVANLNGGPLAGFRNRIINGNFDFWQRGTSFTGSEYGADRWVHRRVGTTHTATRQAFTLGQTDVPSEPQYFCRTVVSSVAGAANFSRLDQQIESVRTFAGQQITFSFWAKADTTKNISVQLQQAFGSGGSPSAEVNFGVTKVSIGTSWQKVTVTATAPSISGKTLGTGNNDSLVAIIWFDAGSSFNSVTDTLGQQSGTFDIAQVQLEPGPIATPFEQRPIGTELALCQRYFEGGVGKIAGYGFNGVGNANPVYFKATKRDTPTLIYAVTSSVNVSVFDIRNAAVSGAEWFAQTGADISYIWTGTWTASAEL